MSNRSASKKHGMHRIERIRPSKKQRIKNNKAANRTRQYARQIAIAEALAAVPA